MEEKIKPLKKLKELKKRFHHPKKIFSSPAFPNFSVEKKDGDFKFGFIYNPKNKTFHGNYFLKKPFSLFNLTDDTQKLNSFNFYLFKLLKNEPFLVLDFDGLVSAYCSTKRVEGVSVTDWSHIKYISLKINREEFVFTLNSLLSTFSGFTPLHKDILYHVLNIYFEGENFVPFRDVLSGLESYPSGSVTDLKVLSSMKHLISILALKEEKEDLKELSSLPEKTVVDLSSLKFSRLKMFLYPFILSNVFHGEDTGKTFLLTRCNPLNYSLENYLSLNDFVEELQKRRNNLIINFDLIHLFDPKFLGLAKNIGFLNHNIFLNRSFLSLERELDMNLPIFLNYLDQEGMVLFERERNQLFLLMHPLF